MTVQQISLIERLRNLLADEPALREVSMFGGRSFMVNEKMAVSALKDGSLLVRVDARRHEALLKTAGATQAEMGRVATWGQGGSRSPLNRSTTMLLSSAGLRLPWSTTALSPNAINDQVLRDE